MFKRITLVAFAILLSTHSVIAQIDSPRLTPVPSSENQKRLIIEGVALHDQRNYDGAISKYDEVLKENPDNVEAIYEMSFSYSMKKDYKKSLELAYRGARYKSELLRGFYVLAGNDLDILGDPNKAIEVYKAGIKLFPHASLLHFNLGVTYDRIGKGDDARKAFKRSATLDPNHPGSNFFLGHIFYKGNYKIPALLAMSRFLVLEPNSERSENAYQVFEEVLRAGVSQGKSPNEINIFLDTSEKKDEGDFSSVSMMLGLTKAAGLSEKNKGKTESELAIEQLEMVFSLLGERSSKESKFVWQYYVPYFSELKRKKYVEPFYYYVSRRKAKPEVKKWLDENFRRVSEFLTWSKQYQWPEIKV